jgi:hypothetical protein
MPMRESSSLRLPKVYFSAFADIEKAFTINKEPSLTILKKCNASNVLVFVPDELRKLYWIAQIAG